MADSDRSAMFDEENGAREVDAELAEASLAEHGRDELDARELDSSFAEGKALR